MAKQNRGSKKQEKPITTDPRFSSVHSDPRFKLPNLNKLKVKVDDRFTKEELTGFKDKKTRYDRYGRKLKEDEGTSAFDKLYKQDTAKAVPESDSESGSKSGSGADSDSDSAPGSESGPESGSESESESDSALKTATATVTAKSVTDRARGEGANSDVESSSSESESDESSDEEIDAESDIEIEEEKPEEGEPERRFAVVNLDWDNVTSVDLFAAFTSFLPPKGAIKEVAIYASEYGKEKMQKEEIEGPPRELFQSKKKKSQEDSDSDSDSDIEDLATAAKKLYEEGDGEQDYDSKALRRYQLQRLRYYYAVVTCDSVFTSKAIYENCDGTEFESSANIFDLRYIPDEMDFEDKPRDSCSKIPVSYKPNSFVTDALQSSKAKLTWDETPTERAKISTKAFSQREIEDMDFQAYLASDSDEEGEQELKDKYKSLVAGSARGGEKSSLEAEEEEVDMEITFTPGLADGAPEPEKAEAKEESTIEAYKRKEKERRKRRLEKFKATQKEGVETKEKDDKKSKNGKADDAKRAELELLTMDSEDAGHFNMKDIIKSEKEKSKKKASKKNAKKIDSEMVQDDFKADLSDPRFREIFEDHDFAIDPTLPNFKKTETMKQILAERQKRRIDSDRQDSQHSSSRKTKKQKTKSHAKPKAQPELSNLVNKIKGKKN